MILALMLHSIVEQIIVERVIVEQVLSWAGCPVEIRFSD